jgi:NADPH:quinone reductase-like Zn-dependent oxidoreductase
MMRAFALDAFGDPGSIREVEREEPQAGEVRVRVIAAGINPVDWKTGLGYLKDWLEHRFPLILGQDVSGVVDAVGPGVSDFRVGDEVFGGHGQPFMGRGTLAEYVVAAPRSLAAKPDQITHAEAAAIPLAGVTALMSVDALGDVRDQPLVVLGAAGGVGSFAVQIARARGAHVIGVASGPNHDYLRGLGVTDLVDYTTTDVGQAVRSAQPAGVAGVIHLAGEADELAPVAALVRDGGTVVSPAGAPPMEAGRINWAMFGADVTGERLTQLLGMRQKGELKLPPMRSFHFEDTSSALQVSAGGHVRGKLVVNVAAASKASPVAAEAAGAREGHD